MAHSNVSALAVFDNSTGLNYIEKDGEILFTFEEIGRHLGYGDPVRAVSKLYERNKDELKLYTLVVKLTTGEQNQLVNCRLFTEEGVYILSMLARTSEAKKFRARVALLLRRCRQETLQRSLQAARSRAALAALALPPYLRDPMRKALGYARRGFSTREAAAVMGTSRRTLRKILAAARELGLGEVSHD